MRKWKWIHKWFSLILGVFVILWAISGIVLNHRQLLSSVDVSRNWFPEAYQYNNWNNAAIRGGIQLGGDSLLIYGNVGVWLTDTSFSSYQSFNRGIKSGSDNRKINKLFKSRQGNIFAASQSGLYLFSNWEQKWLRIPLDLHDNRIVDITARGDKLVFLSRSEIIIADDDRKAVEFDLIELPRAIDDDGRVSLFRTLWVLHSGEIYGTAGVLLVDLLAVLLVFLVVSGFIYFFYPKWIKSRRNKVKSVKAYVNQLRFNQKWHNKIGIWIVGFLIFNTLTGIFLRPPLLIAIADSKVGKIPFSTLSDPNPWHDKLRLIHWNESGGYWLIGTNEGLYKARADMSGPLIPFKTQPPLSVMGINVFEQLQAEMFIVGSFNGLFLWQPGSDYVRDMITGEVPEVKTSAGSPIGTHMISGMIRLPGRNLVFDYNRGLINKHIAMPPVISNAPMPLWNLALEVHTGRFFQGVMGDFYILIIPLFGLALLLILSSGLIRWWKKYHHRKPI
ncbi:MAG: PepSY domain-containing protein [Bacteroidetes bacterium]|nr:PepSY domain-containing protein [Bacteroidota bacterium]